MPATQQRVLNKKLSQIFRMRGLQVRPDAMQPLYDVLEGDENWEETLQALMLEVQSQARAPHRSLPTDAPPAVTPCPARAAKDRCVDGAAITSALEALSARNTQAVPLPLELTNVHDLHPLSFDTVPRGPQHWARQPPHPWPHPTP